MRDDGTGLTAQNQTPATNADMASLETVALRFPGVIRPLTLKGAHDVVETLVSAMPSWAPEITPAGPDDAAAAFSRTEWRKGGYRVSSVFLDRAMNGLTATGAVTALIGDISEGYSAERLDWLAIHCAALRINGHLIALTGPAKTGKSTLAARLMAEEDIEFYCDDALPVMPDGTGVALGFAPRLRLPLPADTAADFRRYVKRFTGPADRHYAYVVAPNIAAHGSKAPLKAVIVLSRKPEAKAALHHLDPADAVRFLLKQDMSDGPDGRSRFEAITDLAVNSICLRLVYSDLEGAVALLRNLCTTDILPNPSVGVLPAIKSPASKPRRAGDPGIEGVFIRSPSAVCRSKGDQQFLYHGTTGACFHLNPVGGIVWQLLEQPIQGTEIAEILAELFPDQPAAAIRRDVASVLGGLVAARLVRRKK